jgi:hypothetical protein
MVVGLGPYCHNAAGGQFRLVLAQPYASGFTDCDVITA